MRYSRLLSGPRFDALAGFLIVLLTAAILLASAGCSSTHPERSEQSAFDPVGKNVSAISDALAKGDVTSVELVDTYVDRINEFDRSGPKINSIIAINPNARREAEALDRERSRGHQRGPLHGIPVIIKDSYDTVGLPTTGGSIALTNAYPSSNSSVVQRLIDAGAIVLAKANMSELAASYGRLGYSSVGGQTLNPFNLKRDSSGSSSGTGAAVAANFAVFGLGTDTSGSIRAPSSVDGLIGIRPTVGLTSRSGVLPFALSMDVTGPMTRSVQDAALALTAIAGSDAKDPLTAAADTRKSAYAANLNSDVLSGSRIGVAVDLFGGNDEVDAAVNNAINEMRSHGADVVTVPLPATMSKLYDTIVGPLGDLEFKRDIEAYLATFPPGTTKTLGDIIAITNSPGAQASEHPANPKRVSAMETAEQVGAAPDAAAKRNQLLNTEMPNVRNELTATYKRLNLDALAFPTLACPASPIFTEEDPTYKCDVDDPYTASYISSSTGFPELTLPVGADSQKLPIGMSFLGLPYTEQRLLDLGGSLEKILPAGAAPSSVS